MLVSNTPSNIINYAKEMAQAHTIQYPHRVAAVLYRGTRVYSYGLNNPFKTHPKASTPYRTIHAEFDAIMRGSRKRLELSKLSLYVHRIRRDKRDGMSKPCKWCQRLIEWSGIEVVDWSK